MIHPTAVIHPSARLHPDVAVGAYAVIDEHVELGPGCRVGPHVYITGDTVAGARNVFFAGCVIGEAPQDLKYSGALTGVRIGDDNMFREHVTVHRSTVPEQWTVVGSGNLFMASSHIGHNSMVGDRVVIANGTLLGGYAQVQDRAFISGCCMVHQLTRVGTLALMQGGSGVSKDLPPFTIAYGANSVCGLNIVGLRRAGMSPAERLELKQLYHVLFREGRPVRSALAQAQTTFASGPARTMLQFISESSRGICVHKERGVTRTRDADEL